jgi:hypothetical protein
LHRLHRYGTNGSRLSVFGRFLKNIGGEKLDWQLDVVVPATIFEWVTVALVMIPNAPVALEHKLFAEVVLALRGS